MKMLRSIEDDMVLHCVLADVDIVIDTGNRVVVLHWNYWQNIEMLMSRKVTFDMLEMSRIDVLKAEAKLGSALFAAGVTKILGDKGL